MRLSPIKNLNMLYTGIDIEEVDRIGHLLKVKPLLLKKLFTAYEWEYAHGKLPSQTLTGIWCAKEAVVKAFSSIITLDIRDIMINHNLQGAPFLYEIKHFLFREQYQVIISISHTKKYAVANCIVSSTIYH